MSGFSIKDLLQAQPRENLATQSPSIDSPVAQQRVLAETMTDLTMKPSYSGAVMIGLVQAIDLLTILSAGLAVYGFYVSAHNVPFLPYLSVAFATGFLSVVAFQIMDIYHVAAFRAVMMQWLRALPALAISFLIVLAILFFLKISDNFSRAWLIGFFLLSLGMIMAQRVLLSVFVRAMMRANRLERRTAIVGGGEPAEELIRSIEKQGDTDIRICGVFDDRNDDRSPDVVGAYPKLGTVDDLVEYARRSPLDLVVFTLPISAEGRILQMLRKLCVLPVDIRLSAHMSKLRFRPRAYSYLGAVPVIDVFDKPIAGWDIILKWLFDRIVGTLILILVSPIMLAAAIAIKLDSKGPVFFRQRRYGFNNELIEVWKFRSMYTDMADATATKLVTKDDPRVTRVGRFIRRTSIDELPQLFNVIVNGNLSLVGPRPHAVHAKAQNRLYDDVVDGYFARHKVKPGITGWAQINGWRGETDTEEKIQRRVECDLYYIENWSLLLDLYILIKTPISLVTKSEGAY